MASAFNEIEDHEIVRQFQDEGNEEKAFSMLVKKHQERLYWHIRRMVLNHEDTNDILQNVFIKVWRGLKNFRSDSSLFTWLYRIGTNETLTFIERNKKNRARSLSDHESYLENTLKAEKGFDITKLEWKLQMAIQSLPPKQKIVFTMRYYDEMTYENMAKILDTTEGGLKATYHLAVKKVEEFILKN